MPCEIRCDDSVATSNKLAAKSASFADWTEYCRLIRRIRNHPFDFGEPLWNMDEAECRLMVSASWALTYFVRHSGCFVVLVRSVYLK